MNPAKARVIRLITIFSVMAVTIGCDQFSKAAARAFLSYSHPIELFGGTLKFTLSQNVGAFLSLGSRLPQIARFLLFSIGGCLAILGGLYYLITKLQLSRRAVIALSFVVGGSVGNQIDRMIFHGSVTDFLFLSLGPVHTGVFNVADMAIMFGVAFFLFESRRRPNPPLNSDPA